MTIEELRQRKRDLALKKYELECQPPDKRDAFALAIVSEEFWDVRDQLKAIDPLRQPRKHKPSVTPGYDFVLNKQQFLKWREEDQSLDDEIAQGHAELRDETARALPRLTPCQRTALEMKMKGRSIGESAQALGVSRRIVINRTSRAKKSLRAEVEKALTRKRLLDGKRVLDLMDTDIMKAVLLVMSSTQAAYFYLYLSEGMSASEIGKLLNCDRSNAFTEIPVALRKIDVLLDGQDVLLEHPEALDELGYKAYCELCAHPELIPEERYSPKIYRRLRRKDPTPPQHVPYRCSIHVQVCKRRVKPGTPPGKLRAALMDRGEDILPALTTVFSFCQYRFEQHMDISTSDKEKINDR